MKNKTVELLVVWPLILVSLLACVQLLSALKGLS